MKPRKKKTIVINVYVETKITLQKGRRQIKKGTKDKIIGKYEIAFDFHLKNTSRIKGFCDRAITTFLLKNLQSNDDEGIFYDISKDEIVKLLKDDEPSKKKKKKNQSEILFKHNIKDKTNNFSFSTKIIYDFQTFDENAQKNKNVKKKFENDLIHFENKNVKKKFENDLIHFEMINNQKNVKNKIKKNIDYIEKKKSKMITKKTKNITSFKTDFTSQNRGIIMMRQNEKNLMQFLLSSEFFYNVDLSAITTSTKEVFEKIMLKIHEKIMTYLNDKNVDEKNIVLEQRQQDKSGGIKPEE